MTLKGTETTDPAQHDEIKVPTVIVKVSVPVKSPKLVTPVAERIPPLRVEYLIQEFELVYCEAVC